MQKTKVVIEIDRDKYTMTLIESNGESYSEEWERTEGGSRCKTKDGESELAKYCDEVLYEAITDTFNYDDIMHELDSNMIED